MVKRSLNLNVDDELIQLAKAKQINISNLVNNILNAELTHENLFEIENKDDMINKLKGRIAILSNEINELTESIKTSELELSKINKEILELKDKHSKELIEMKEKYLIELKKLKDKKSDIIGGRVLYSA